MAERDVELARAGVLAVTLAMVDGYVSRDAPYEALDAAMDRLVAAVRADKPPRKLPALKLPRRSRGG